MSEIEVEFGLSDSDISERAKVADKVNALISDTIPGKKKISDEIIQNGNINFILVL